MLSEKVRSGFGDGRRKQEYKNEIIKKNMANNEPGYVYILTNHCYRADWVKIGNSRRPRRGDRVYGSENPPVVKRLS